MAPQVFDWTCSICSFTWVLNSTEIDPLLTRDAAGVLIGYPECVNETYGLTSIDCLINAFHSYSLSVVHEWVTFEKAYAICTYHTGVINPIGMYHFMAIRGVDHSDPGTLWLANSAPGYRGIYEEMTRDQFNALGPVQVLYLLP